MSTLRTRSGLTIEASPPAYDAPNVHLLGIAPEVCEHGATRTAMHSLHMEAVTCQACRTWYANHVSAVQERDTRMQAMRTPCKPMNEQKAELNYLTGRVRVDWKPSPVEHEVSMHTRSDMLPCPRCGTLTLITEFSEEVHEWMRPFARAGDVSRTRLCKPCVTDLGKIGNAPVHTVANKARKAEEIRFPVVMARVQAGAVPSGKV